MSGKIRITFFWTNGRHEYCGPSEFDSYVARLGKPCYLNINYPDGLVTYKKI